MHCYFCQNFSSNAIYDIFPSVDIDCRFYRIRCYTSLEKNQRCVLIDIQTIKAITVKTVKDSFRSYFSSPKKETKHILLDRFFDSERRITSCMSGLQTSLGSFWETLAKAFLRTNNYPVLPNETMKRPVSQPIDMTDLITRIKARRQNEGGSLDELKEELNMLYPQPTTQVEFTNMQKGKGSDLIFNVHDTVYICDLKTVQVNANNGNTFDESVILWTCYYKYCYQVDARNIRGCFVFPYNSADELNDELWWEDFGGRVSPLTHEEVLVGNQFWSLVTGNNEALSAIIDAFDEIAMDEDFISFYRQVFSCIGQEQLNSFSLRVKHRKIKEDYSICLCPGQQLVGGRTQLRWRHTGMNSGECYFNATISSLINGRLSCCPTCGNSITVLGA